MVTRHQVLQAVAAVSIAGQLAAFVARGPALTAARLAGHFAHDGVRLRLQASVASVAGISFWPEPGKEINAGGEPV